ncbi:universal stress protein [Natrinema ejinorense]|uniref:Universal stress protein UspA n=1 Tax=Natrinema ejinorense TaxID=373386 RepID=A0A2A5QRT4_9EURY|nr:universal stress protein [Natrinema ejinorense]PCR89547.1 universal stress protein UspA [Natrinema ejinorense]
MYEDILLPFDGSDGAAETLHHAAEIAHWADATIHVLFVADTTRDSVTVVETRVVDALVREGEGIVEEAEKTLDTLGVDYDSDVVQGNPAPTVVEYAERYDHDLIVMPTHGREGVSRYLIGSVTEKVIRLSSVPVLTARMQPDERLAFPYEDILLPTDGSATATRAAEHGLSFAAALDATVHVLSVVDDTSLGLDVRSTVSGRNSEQAGTDAVDELVSEAETRGISNAVRYVERGSPIEVILDTIESNDIHAVVMGTTGRRGSDRILLGSVAEKTARSAPVPVITVRHDE